MFRGFNRALDALERIATSLATLSRARGEQLESGADVGPFLGRLDELERSRAVWEAEIEALLIKAEGTFKGARNAEERTRHMVKAGDDGTEDGASNGESELIEALQRQLLAANGGPGEGEGVPPVREDVGLSGKGWAQRMKYGA